ncbi:MAG: VPLPA-CTERM sorting domain-containing protein [Planctomycetota bacterium]|jgi:hypothetical protein
MRSRPSIKSLLLTTVLIVGFLIVGINTASGSISFSIFSSGTTDGSFTVSPGGIFSIDVVAMDIMAEGFTRAELDAFTYRVNFPNQNFTLVGNAFTSPFDNTQAPFGFNGSIPWYTGSSIPITNGADAGSPGATPFAADLYRTTATQLGTPVTGSFAVLETTNLLAPTNIKESFNVNVVPIPSSILLLSGAMAALAIFRRRRR